MPQARVGDLSLEYRSDGPPDAPPLLLIMGTAAPLTMWDDAFCAALSARGFRVIRFDYRDTGRSSRVDAPMPSTIGAMMRAFAEGKLAPPYALEDLADDTVGLLDALGVERAHLVGLSQGAGVAQLVAARASERVTGSTLLATSRRPPPRRWGCCCPTCRTIGPASSSGTSSCTRRPAGSTRRRTSIGSAVARSGPGTTAGTSRAFCATCWQ